MALSCFRGILTGWLFGAGTLLATAVPPYTIINGAMQGSGTTVSGWDGIAVSGRENGPYQCTMAHQVANSPFDPDTASGSVVITGTSLACSFTQQLGITATGQTLRVAADIAWDGDWNYLFFGFYEDNVWDRDLNASVDITLTVPPDTDGTLNTFTTVYVQGTLVNDSNPVRVFFGSACTPYTGGPKTVGVSKFAVDNVRALDAIPSAVEDWLLFE